MTQYYSFHKGKHGGIAGYIFPFFTSLPSLFPDETYSQYVPAGFLKCQGQILPASRYRALADAIGVGSNCIYKKDGVDLDNPDQNGEGGEIQLPDLGSKYVAGSLNPGQYQNFETSQGEGFDRAGIGVEISAIGDNIDFFYTGDFRVISRSTTEGNLSISGAVTSISPPSITEETTLTMTNFLPHGHNANYKVGRRINQNGLGISSASWRSCSYYCTFRGDIASCRGNANYGYEFKFVSLTESGTDEGATHFHSNALPRITNETKSASTSEVLIPAAALTTNLKVKTNQKFKLDEFAPKYILCEYLIKY